MHYGCNQGKSIVDTFNGKFDHEGKVVESFKRNTWSKSTRRSLPTPDLKSIDAA